ncbi:GntR family transcriptional regulator [Sinosporangium album]|uniref:GntR family transcriptional regulator n=1 Tax=Sinosporangium album TaxID=504805 RepID=UPI00159FE98D|nr:GntR family transcriptional regulator [Sinosporangium album]
MFDRVNGWSAYARVMERLLFDIADGVHPPGSYLPSEKILTADLQVSRNAVRRALTALAEEEVVVVVPSKGWLVCGSPAPEVVLEYRYRTVADDLRKKIAAGLYAPGAILPSQVSLQRFYQCGEETVRRALRLLEKERLILRDHGRRVVCG